MIDGSEVLAHPIIPVVEIGNAHNAVPLSEALLAGGISVIEITLRTAAALDAIKQIRKQTPEMLVGVGTVSTLEQSLNARNAGAQFGVSPGCNREVIQSFQQAGLPFIPGVMTPTEIESAMQENCHFLKFFPASAAGGPSTLKAFSGPYLGQGVQFCATGGVTLENMQSYLDLPIVNSIGGSWLATPRQIAEREWTKITEQAHQACSMTAKGESK